MTVKELIEILKKFDSDKEVKLNLTDDYRDRCYDMNEDDVYFDDYEDAVVIDGSTLGAWYKNH